MLKESKAPQAADFVSSAVTEVSVTDVVALKIVSVMKNKGGGTCLTPK